MQLATRVGQAGQARWATQAPGATRGHKERLGQLEVLEIPALPDNKEIQDIPVRKHHSALMTNFMYFFIVFRVVFCREVLRMKRFVFESKTRTSYVKESAYELHLTYAVIFVVSKNLERI